MTEPTDLRDVGQFWYEVAATEDLRQGDVLFDLPVFWLPDDFEDSIGAAGAVASAPVLSREVGTYIVLSASCDIQPNRTGGGQVLLGKVYACTGENLNNPRTPKELQERVEVLRRGFDPQRYLLAAHQRDPIMPLSFVGFRTQLTMPLAYIRRSSLQRLRLKSPHRERFGNWAGSSLSRVGIEDSEQIGYAKPPALYPAQVLRALID